ncbi:BTAD domain-containing putative transcriptional regulator [Micromonospora sp. WMMD964]|uniref:AfsR/SARP family transcriptional regulator n=1 Tax=Micromonospora sp. WMMD964 TaxID=3016091 RepID=UPI00249BAC0E|nr:BTAD domain-containing putative transcriptional regulator [Micromonospora sp. WMMD964]WFE99978.1 BTAD domain-containing putative transcriptional regulator [Micromonospora sp. WMMD964]
MTRVRFLALGPLHAEVGRTLLDLGPVRQQAVFAILLFNADRVVTPATILQGVWGEQTPPTGAKVIPPYIYRLRRTLQAAGVGHDGPAIDSLRIGYRLRLGSAGTDVADFDEAVDRAAAAERAGDLAGAAELLAEAERNWAGEPLAGLTGPYAQSRRQHLLERRVVCLEHRLELHLRLGDSRRAIPALVALQAEYPLRERLTIMLMAALYQAGRQGEAMDVFSAFRTRLATELGVEPTPALVAAYTSMLHGALGLPPMPGGPAEGNARARAATTT